MFFRNKEKQQASDVRKVMKFTGLEIEAAEDLYYESDFKDLDHLEERWKESEALKKARREYFEHKLYFAKQLGKIPALLKKPTLKKLAEVVLIQNEYIIHLNTNFGCNGFGMVIDSSFLESS